MYKISFNERRGKVFARLKLNNKDVKAKTFDVDVTDVHKVEMLVRQYELRVHEANIIKKANKLFDVPSYVFENKDRSDYSFKQFNKQNKCKSFIEFAGGNISISDITNEILMQYKEYLEDEGYSTNTIRTYLNEVRVVLNRASMNNIPLKANMYTKILRGKVGDTTSVYLTTSELDKMYRLITHKNEMLSEQEFTCVAMFLIGAYTGARYSDYSSLTSDNVITDTDYKGNQTAYISYLSKKTNKVVKTPYTIRAGVLLDFIKGRRTIDISTMNRILPKICDSIGINQVCSVIKSDNETLGKKCDFVRSHTARKSFATNLYLNGVELLKISKWMGHSNSSITEKSYIVCPMIDNENVVSKIFDK